MGREDKAPLKAPEDEGGAARRQVRLAMVRGMLVWVQTGFMGRLSQRDWIIPGEWQARHGADTKVPLLFLSDRHFRVPAVRPKQL